MQLYFMQHGQAVAEPEDPTRPLSRAGVEQIKATASAIKRLGLTFDVVICSPKRRSHQSAALIAEAIRYPYSDILESETVLPKAAPEELLKKLDQMIGDKILIVGHQPHLSRLVSALMKCENELVSFENGGLVAVARIDVDYRITSVLSAGQMREIGER